jgi:DNA-directed RNA polymerase subunit H (RpoH/RPB5)
MDNTSLKHILIESRKTILDLLDRRGYNTEPHRKIVGPELLKLVNTPEALRMTLENKQDTEKKCIVEYVFRNIKVLVGSGDFVRKLLEPPAESVSKAEKASMLHTLDAATTEVVIIYMTRAHSEDTLSYDKGALEAWMKHKFRVQFFPMPRLVSNPLEHVLQPRFEIVPTDQHQELLKEWYCLNEHQTLAQNKAKLPSIKFHNDMAARCLGLMPLDIVKITTFSPTAGEYVKYRVCVP